jgi:PAS domain S-box-containing protein
MTKILVVEDERIVALDIKNRLEDLGYQVPAMASSGQEAIDKAQETKPDLVLMDIRLEGEMDGIEAAEAIRLRFYIPVLYLTALTDEETLRRAKATQPFGFLVKPFENRDLYSTIEVALHRHQLERQLSESEERYRLHFESVSDVVFSLDSELRLLTVSPSVKSVIGYEPEELIGRSLPELDLLTPESVETAAAATNRVLAGEMSRPWVYEFKTKDGSRKLVEISGSPLIRKDDTVAILAVARDVTERSRAEEALARQALELERSNAFIAALSQVAARLGRTRDPEQILESLGAELKALGMICVVAFLDSDNQDLVVQYASIESTALKAAEKLVGFKLQGLRFPNEAWPVRQIMKAGQAIFAPDPLEVMSALLPSVPEGLVERAIRLVGVPVDNTMLYLPLVMKEQITGVMAVWGEDLRDEDLVAFQVFAAQVAGTLEGARLYDEAQQRAEELDALNRAGQTIASSLDLDRVLTQITDEVRTLLNAEAASVLLYEPAKDELVFTAASSPALEVLLGVRMPADAGIAGWVFREGKAALVDNPQKDPRFYPRIDALTGMTTKSLLAVPLTHGERLVGVLEAINREGELFDERDLYMLGTLAGPASIAIENARLYDETARRLTETRVLREVMLAAASTLDFDQVLELTFETLERAMKAEYLGFVLPAEDGESLRLHPTVVGFQTVPEDYRLPLEESICGRVFRTGEPVLIGDVHNEPDYYEGAPEVCSELAVPVRAGGELIGVLNLESSQPHAFGEEDQAFYVSIAAQLGMSLDNARLYEVEREQRQLVERSQAQLVQSEKMAALGRLVASLAHEINNPLQALHSGFRLLMSDGPNQEEHQRYLEVANREVKRLITILERVLGFVRPSSEQQAPSDINNLLDETLLLLGKQLEDGGIVVQRHLAPDLPLIEGRAGELRQVFLNLILNALQAMPESGTLTVETRQDGADEIHVSFSDTGTGIPEDVFPHLFEPFFTTRAEGSGLGLATSYGIVERHRGRIEVESKVGEGSTFTVVLRITGGTPDAELGADAGIG